VIREGLVPDLKRSHRRLMNPKKYGFFIRCLRDFLALFKVFPFFRGKGKINIYGKNWH
jgi:hypothetical protein